MFEFESGIRALHGESAPFADGALEEALGARIKRRSVIVWQEHCSECAMPGCYATCSLYTPRWDYKCRRFPNGVSILEPTKYTAAPMRIQFGQWARLLGRGPTPLYELSDAHELEAQALKFAERAHSISSHVRGFAAPLMRRRVARRSRSHSFGNAASDLFIIIESSNAGPAAVSMSITCKVLDEPGAATRNRPFEATLTFAPGYNVHAININAFALAGDLDRLFSIELAPSNWSETPELTFGFIDVAELSSAPRPEVVVGAPSPVKKLTAAAKQASSAPKAKCVIWDLDNTLWNGVLIEDDIQNLRLRPEAVAAIRELDRRGILQSVASKNDHDLAMGALKHFGLAEFFLSPQISWGPKSNAISIIAQRLNIGSDTFVFVDDQEFERAEVVSRHPEVMALDSADLGAVCAHPRLDVEVTLEAATRRQMYQEEEQRTVLLESSNTSYEEFLRSCGMKVQILELQEEDVPRAHELSQRTNQLNIWSSRYTTDQLRSFLTSESPARAFTIRAEDRFGSYGLVGLCIVKGRVVQDLMFSCRIQGKLVGEAFSAWLAARLGTPGAPVQARYKVTRKNGPARALLEASGFIRSGDVDDGELWSQTGVFRSLDELTTILEIQAPELAPGGPDAPGGAPSAAERSSG
jgi:FkbH-like protein